MMSSEARTEALTIRLVDKRDALHEIARRYTFGAATADDLDVAAVEFSEALADRAMAGLRGRMR